MLVFFTSKIVLCFLFQMGFCIIIVMAETSFLQLVSYNCRGFNSKKNAYINSLLDNSTFLFLQEHWLADAQLSDLVTDLPDILYLRI